MKDFVKFVVGVSVAAVTFAGVLFCYTSVVLYCGLQHFLECSTLRRN